VFIALGWALGSRWELAREYISLIEYAVLAVLAAVIFRLAWRRLRKPHK
jgi:membrane protein DedA with SNARE-associated domain